MKDIKKTVCNKNTCTACGACKVVCPVQCIDMKEDKIGTLYPRVNVEKCVNCGLCSKVCHIVNYAEDNFHYPVKAFVGYAKDSDVRKNGASGGVASALYLYSLKKNYFIMGTRLDLEKGCYFEQLISKEDLKWSRNSKYVFSDMSGCYKEYEKHLKAGKKCLFIGLPCQATAIRTYLSAKNISSDNLFMVEVICHGVPSWKILREHLEYIENKTRQKIRNLSFRERSDFFIVCRNLNGETIYKKPLRGSDEYYKSFTAGLSLRDSCYNCKYAQRKRRADITIGDFPGIGSRDNYFGERKEISSILISSLKGLELIHELSREGYLFIEERKVEEVIEDAGNPQLRSPMKKHCEREKFAQLYEKMTFEKSVRKALAREYLRLYIYIPFWGLKDVLKNHLSEKSLTRLKRILRRTK